MEKQLLNGQEVKVKKDGRILKIDSSIETNNQFGSGVYLYRFVGELENGFGLYRKEIDVISE
jgi:hypothetical protein